MNDLTEERLKQIEKYADSGHTDVGAKILAQMLKEAIREIFRLRGTKP